VPSRPQEFPHGYPKHASITFSFAHNILQTQFRNFLNLPPGLFHFGFPVIVQAPGEPREDFFFGVQPGTENEWKTEFGGIGRIEVAEAFFFLGSHTEQPGLLLFGLRFCGERLVLLHAGGKVWVDLDEIQHGGRTGIFHLGYHRLQKLGLASEGTPAGNCLPNPMVNKKSVFSVSCVEQTSTPFSK